MYTILNPVVSLSHVNWMSVQIIHFIILNGNMAFPATLLSTMGVCVCVCCLTYLVFIAYLFACVLFASKHQLIFSNFCNKLLILQLSTLLACIRNKNRLTVSGFLFFNVFHSSSHSFVYICLYRLMFYSLHWFLHLLDRMCRIEIAFSFIDNAIWLNSHSVSIEITKHAPQT